MATQLTLDDLVSVPQEQPSAVRPERPVHKFYLETGGQTYEFARILDRQWFIKTNGIKQGRCWFTTNGKYIDGYDFAPSPITGV